LVLIGPSRALAGTERAHHNAFFRLRGIRHRPGAHHVSAAAKALTLRRCPCWRGRA